MFKIKRPAVQKNHRIRIRVCGRFSAGHWDMAFVATAFFVATQQGNFCELASASLIQVAWSVIRAQLTTLIRNRRSFAIGTLSRASHGFKHETVARCYDSIRNIQAAAAKLRVTLLPAHVKHQRRDPAQ